MPHTNSPFGLLSGVLKGALPFPQFADGVEFPYTPTTLADWDGAADPGDVADALDQLAERTTDLEAGGAGVTSVSGTAPIASSGGATPAISLNDDGVSDAKLRNSGACSVIGRSANSTGDPADISAASDDQFLCRRAGVLGFGGLVAADIPAHATSHQSGGSDAIKLDDLSAPDDNTDLNASVAAHGLLRKLSNVATEYLDGTGGWSVPAGAGTVDAEDVTYTPVDVDMWDGAADPGDVNDALDQLADRVTEIEDSGVPTDASVVTFTPADDTDWNGDADPGDVDEALDQLAERTTALEALATPDAGDVTYSPADTADWDGGTDPGDVADALDQLADRVAENENSGGAHSVWGRSANTLGARGDIAATGDKQVLIYRASPDVIGFDTLLGTDIPAADATTRGTVELADDGEVAAGLAVQANDARLSDSRTPEGSAGGELSGTYPDPELNIHGMTEGTGLDENHMVPIRTGSGNRKVRASWFYPQGYIFGLECYSDSGDPSHDMVIVGGCAKSATNEQTAFLTTSLVKRLDANWTAGTNQGGLDTGSPANNTWYYAFLIRDSVSGVVDVMFSTSPTSPGVTGDYGVVCRLRGFRTDGSANIIKTFQIGRRCYYASPPLDVSDSSLAATRETYSLGYVPPSYSVLATFAVAFNDAGNITAWLTSPDQDDDAPGTDRQAFHTAFARDGRIKLHTSATGTICARGSSAGGDFYVRVIDWEEPYA